MSSRSIRRYRRPELVDLPLLDARDELVGELLGRRVDDALAREAGDDLVPDRVHQVGLAEADPAVQEERVVGMARALRHRQAGGVGETIGRPDDEVRERVAGIEVRRPALAADPGRLDTDVLAGRALGGGALGGCPVHRRRCLRGRPDDEFDLDAVPDDPSQRLADQGPVSGLQPVLRETVRDGDPEALLVHVDELRVSQPGFVVRGRQGDLELTEGGSPDLLRVHSFDGTCDSVTVDKAAPVTPGVGEARSAKRPSTRIRGRMTRCHATSEACVRISRERPGAEGPERIAPAPMASQGDSRILHGSIRAEHRGRQGQRLFDTPSGQAISSAGRRRAMRPWGAGAFACL